MPYGYNTSNQAYLGSDYVGNVYLGSERAGLNPFTYAGPTTEEIVLYLDASNVNSYPGTGTKWYDLSGNANTGSITGSLSFASSSLVFDNNVNNYVQIPHNSTLNVFDGDFTVDFWYTVSTGSSVNDNTAFWFKGTSFAANPGIGQLMNRNINAGDYKQGAYYINNTPKPSQNYLTQDGINFVFNKWYNLQYVRSGLDIQVYSGGTLINSITDTLVRNCNNTDSITIGKGSTVSIPAQGNIATLLIYDKALDTNELKRNYDWYSSIYF